MVVGGSQQKTLDPGFVLLDTHQQGVPVILSELVLHDGFNPVSPSFTVRDVIVVGGSHQETLDPCFVLFGTYQQGIPIILRELMLPDGFNPVSPSFTVSDVNIELSGLRLSSCKTEMYS
ncbi:unnamed protein product [Schistosoma mattheei]|uniref:Uncharacterized protein n=1 Tax=Schistosoma mattheei TaxID=31246 RepID=A0A183NRK8_9TREM|nr:unnamed protein product [Schistosoma mattheei]